MGEIFQRVLPQSQLPWTGERLVTGVGGQIEIEHLHRYMYAREFCRDLDVLDVASGEGYGTALLADVARSAVGVEISVEAADHAAHHYRAGNLRFLQGDARKIPIADCSVDVVTSFETIEHFYEQRLFLEEVRRVLRPNGLFIVSSPDRDTYSPAESEANPFHKQELSRREFDSLLRGVFPHVRFLCQRTLLGSVLLSDDGDPGPIITIEKRGDNHFERSNGVSRSPYLVAIASGAVLSPVANSIYVDTGEIGPMMARAAEHEALRVGFLEAKGRAERAETAMAESMCRLDAQDREMSSLRLENHLDRPAVQQSTSMAKERSARHALVPATDSLSAGEAESFVDSAYVRLKHEYEGALTDLRQACTQRDMARLALRRCHIRAEQLWAPRLAATEAIIADLQARLRSSEASGRDWQAKYEGLRRRLEVFLFRSGLYRASRMIPAALRRGIKARVFISNAH